jgi:MoxR-like ATPase
MQQEFAPRIELEIIKNSVEQIRAEIKKIVIGQDDAIDLLIAAVFTGGHVLIEGVPGVAKTLTAKILARTLSVEYQRVQFTPDLMPSDVVGTSVFNPKNAEFEFHRGPVFSNIVLADEINRAPAKTQAALFEVMEESQVTVDGITYKFDPPFIVIATQNPIEHEGTYRLPEAQIDRFLFKINISYPGIEDEVQILKSKHEKFDYLNLNRIEPVLNKEELNKINELLHSVIVSDEIIKYIANIVIATRNDSRLELGGSPRASSAILNGAKTIAAMNGRDFVTPDDVRFMALPVLRHRIIPAPEIEMEGTSNDDIIKMIIQGIEVPR